VDVRIGVTQAPREIELELDDEADADRVVKMFEDALAGESAVLWLTDRKGRRIGVPAAKVAYVEIGSPNEERRVGFGASVVAR
jgi:protein tyrosine/serine phosphatase